MVLFLPVHSPTETAVSSKHWVFFCMRWRFW